MSNPTPCPQSTQQPSDKLTINIDVDTIRVEFLESCPFTPQQLLANAFPEQFDQHGQPCSADLQAALKTIKDNCLQLPIRFLPRLQEVVEKSGLARVEEIQDAADWPQFSRTNKALFQSPVLRPYHRDLLQAISNQSRGWISLQKMSDAVEVIDAMLQLYPHEYVQVVTKNNRSSNRLAKQLSQATGREVLINTEPKSGNQPALGVCSLANFKFANVSTWTCIILVGDEVACADTTVTQLQCMAGALHFAIVPISQSPKHKRYARLTALYSHELYRLDNIPPQLTDVSVVWLPPATYPAADPQDPLERKRTLLWHNQQRNQQIAELAQAIGENDFRTVERLRVDLRGANLSESADSLSVAILVEGPEHGRALQQLLPDWQLQLMNGTAAEEKLPLEVERLIVTQQRAAHAGIAARVVIRAEGTAHKWNDDFGPHNFFTGPRMLVIDCQDDFDLRARQDSQRRVEDYVTRNWNMNGDFLVKGGTQ